MFALLQFRRQRRAAEQFIAAEHLRIGRHRGKTDFRPGRLKPGADGLFLVETFQRDVRAEREITLRLNLHEIVTGWEVPDGDRRFSLADAIY